MSDLRTAIEEQVAAGQVDPYVIAHTVRTSYGERWLTKQLAALAGEIVATYARQAVGSSRRRAEHGFGSGSEGVRQAVVALQGEGCWVPSVGWKRHADLTADDCREVAEHYGMIVSAAGIRARRYAAFAELIEAEGVETLGQTSAELPGLEEAA